jgi:putative glutamine amidotransferase
MDYLKSKPKINRDRPTIGITGPDQGGGMAWFFTSWGVRLAGGKPVRITPRNPRTADGLQALIVGGGADVDPSTYQQENVFQEYLNRTLLHPRKSAWQKARRAVRWLYYPALFLLRKLLSRKPRWGLDKDRDHLEIQLIDQAVKKQLPIMGICRGTQLLNVYFRGTLHQDIGNFYQEEPNPSSLFPVKRITLEPDSRLARVLGAQQLKVNALHHQAIKDPGRNVRIVAREANDVVQAIEVAGPNYVVGVQWHPEYLPQRREQRRLFQELVHWAKQVNRQIEEVDMREALATPDPQQLKEAQQAVAG